MAPEGRTRVVVLAGGSGTRFWPASRRRHPKHLLKLLPGERSLLQATVGRVADLGGDADVTILTAQDQREAVCADLSGLLASSAVVAEPEARNTAPAIVLAAARLLADGAAETDPVVVLPSDAWVDDDLAFRQTLERACQAAVSHSAIVAVGIPPSHAATGYGYLELGEPAEPGQDGSPRRVERFCEKPDAALAEEFLAGGRHHWNAGIFVFTLATLQRTLREVAPDLAQLADALGECFRAGDSAAADRLYRSASPISFDYAVMEHADGLLCVGASFAWSDLGSWDALQPVLETGDAGAFRAAGLVSKAAEGNVVFAPGRTVGLLGVEGLVVVATDDAILVASADRAQEVRALTELLREQGMEELL
ncbi:MAG: mannose-1-phosphate guanylyltransferase [Myxococcota bacterium]|nr:mannose-1-phosphate guanylyltransferase [Myxococcota bacterium]